jgi:hypothetical protein
MIPVAGMPNHLRGNTKKEYAAQRDFQLRESAVLIAAFTPH